MKDVIILGAGGHARVVIDALRRLNMHISGIVAPRAPDGWQDIEIPLLGDDAWLLRRGPEGIVLANGLGGIAPLGKRAAAYERFKENQFHFLTVIDPDAIVSKYAFVGEGSFLAAGSVVQTQTRIGRNCIINTGALVDHDCLIEDHVQIAPGAVLAGGIIVRRGAYVGLGAKILQGIAIGEASQIAAGAVVVRDVRAETLVVGVPARERVQ